MAAKSLHGVTRGTPLETMTSMLAQSEAKGVMMYYALARLARDQGLGDASKSSSRPQIRKPIMPGSMPC